VASYDYYDEEQDIIEELFIETLRVVNAMKSSNVDRLMCENKELVFSKIRSKMDTKQLICSAKSNRYGIWNYLLIASVFLLLIASTVALYYYGTYKSRMVELAKTQIHLKVPFGVISQMILPDGSRVILNGGSKISYPVIFTSSRQIDFSGEGFFEVVKDENNPFIINSKNISVKVLGTRFGIKAYDEDVKTILTLKEGSVKVFPFGMDIKEGVFLEPDQQLIIRNDTKEFQRRNVIADDYTAWKEGIFIFKNQALSEISATLERRFNVKINIKSDLIGSEQYTAQFRYGENVEQILEKLSHKRSWRVIKKNGIIELTGN
jgi:ferric-dicitrate binding protein FerR (iron transport regulator)